jgi:hypothetical protein
MVSFINDITVEKLIEIGLTPARAQLVKYYRPDLDLTKISGIGPIKCIS